MTSGGGKHTFSLSLCPEPLICLWQVNCIQGLPAVPVLEVGQRTLVGWSTQIRVATQAAPGVHRQSPSLKREARQPWPQVQKSLDQGSKAKIQCPGAGREGVRPVTWGCVCN